MPQADLLLVGLLLAVTSLDCAPVIKRDLSSVPAGRVGFDDMCGLQTYFDRLEMKIGTPPAVVDAVEVQGRRGSLSGRTRFTFSTEAQLQAVRQVLTENWKRLPVDTMTAAPIEIEVRWSERSGVRRVVTNEAAILGVARSETSLPYHVCLSELLFGEPLYHQRRSALGLGPLPSAPSIVRSTGDGGVAVDVAATPAPATGPLATDGGVGPH